MADDGSTDDTERVLSGFGGRARFLRQANQGPGAARNLGLSEARGEFVVFLDSDDVWFPWALRNFHQIAQRASKPGFIIGTVVNFSERADLSSVKDAKITAVEYEDYLAAGQKPGFELLTCSSVCVRRK